MANLENYLAASQDCTAIPKHLTTEQSHILQNQDEMVSYINAWAKTEQELRLKMCTAVQRQGNLDSTVDDTMTNNLKEELVTVQSQLAKNQEEMVSYINAWAKQQQELILQMCDSAECHDLQDSRECATSTSEGPVASPRQTRCTPNASDLAASDLVEEASEDGAATTRETMRQQMNNMRSMSVDFREVGLLKGMASFSSTQPRTSGSCVTVFRSKYFESVCSLVIVGNAFFMAYMTDLKVADAMTGENSTNLATFLTEFAFTTFYTLEIVLRVYVQRADFIVGFDWKWNAFDALLVGLAWYDIGMEVFADAPSANLSFLRVMRLMKMCKLLRMVRIMKSFKELRLIVASVMSSMKSMVWAILLILTVAFVFGMAIVQAISPYLNDNRSRLTQEELDYLLHRWGSISNAIYTLYLASTGGGDWEEMANVLLPVGTLYFYFFLLYIGFFFCVVTNTLTSLFVESALADSEKDQQAVIQAELEAKDKYIKMLEKWYSRLDEDGSGDISLDEFMNHVNDPLMVAFAAEMEINIGEVKQFFTVLSSHGRRAVTLDSFVVGCIKLKGMAKAMDLMDLSYSHKQSAADLRKLAARTDEGLSAMDQKIDQKFDSLFALIAGIKGCESPRALRQL